LIQEKRKQNARYFEFFLVGLCKRAKLTSQDLEIYFTSTIIKMKSTFIQARAVIVLLVLAIVSAFTTVPTFTAQKNSLMSLYMADESKTLSKGTVKW